MIKKYISIAALTFVLLNISACKKNFLDVSSELASQLTMEEIFSNATYSRQWHRNIFTGIVNSSGIILNTGSGGVTGLDNPWPAFTDELKNAQGTLRSTTSTGYNAGSAPFSRWNLFQLIRQANIFLEKAVVIPNTGGTDFIEEAELTKMKAQARFLRAYYYYLLFELYGPVPILDKSVDPGSSELDFERNSVDEVVKFISDELTAVANQLDIQITDQNFLALPTKGVALAIKAKLLVYAASPLFNGEFPEALVLTNPSGKKLFPVKDDTKWQKALTALEEFIEFSNGKYELYRANTNGVYDVDKTLYEMFMKYNNEIIWANPNELWGNVGGDGTQRRATPRNQGQGFACIAVTQELVDDFFMNDGLPIEESPAYSETGFSIAGEDPSNRTEAGTYRMWVKREPRFYQSVFYHGRKWHVTNGVVKFNKGNGNDNSAADYPWSGYLMYKRISRIVHNTGSNPKTDYHPSIIFRLAEFYLLYAEALNEVRPNDPKIIEYVDKIRERAGIPKLSVIKPGIIGNKDLQREAIRREMRVELCMEGQRYFDVRRWMIAGNAVGDGGQAGSFYGMNMAANTEADFFKRTTYETRVFSKSMYLFPIPLTEIQKSKKLIQNPLW
ncbi:RagB/SusD family nutrient uptake outer membrane protein [Pedobacter frigoris]|uniref:RagB/SusD family nutrient uptake outer membrane protein n=1 Tax=Pedobacter frigoris TaxID=2571272 RepID=A0A4U1CNI9_9SPHI|nr:RagB/SusD family nutrient uptake outer membrane protein [Pedobacter frigoris]TKC09507.1 RagB/SusD family nutrient uptake outer membrane protein [Pedobacter frigoris]